MVAAHVGEGLEHSYTGRTHDGLFPDGLTGANIARSLYPFYFNARGEWIRSGKWQWFSSELESLIVGPEKRS